MEREWIPFWDFAHQQGCPDYVMKFIEWHSRDILTKVYDTRPPPELYGLFRGKVVKVTWTSILGDIGVSFDLDRREGYDMRMSMNDLCRFFRCREEAMSRTS